MGVHFCFTRGSRTSLVRAGASRSQIRVTGWQTGYLRQTSNASSPLRSGELVFANNAFVAVQLALHTILHNASLFGQQTHILKLPRALPSWYLSGEKWTVCPTANLCACIFRSPGARRNFLWCGGAVFRGRPATSLIARSTSPWHRNPSIAFPLEPLAERLSVAPDRFGLLPDAAFRRFFVGPAPLHVAKGAFALHLFLEHPQCANLCRCREQTPAYLTPLGRLVI